MKKSKSEKFINKNTKRIKLELKSQQILPLEQYLEKHREILQEELHNYS